MITCNLMGGLGNQLFQIFTTIAYGIKTGNPFLFPNLEKLGGGKTIIRKTYWKTLLNNMIVIPAEKFPSNIQLIKEYGFEYKMIPLEKIKNRHILLYGYFQSYKYFIQEFKTIYKQLKFHNKKIELMEKLGMNPDDFKNTISLHFRRGDYKKIQDCHPVLNIDYYQSGLQFIYETYPKNIFKIYYCCEEDDFEDVLDMIQTLEKKYPSFNFERCSSELVDWEQLLFMSLCNHNIIANSSFSWWSALLNDDQNSIKCYPSIWFGASQPHNTRDLFPPTWNCIQTDYTFKVYQKFILFHQPKTAGTYALTCLPEGYVLPHNQNHHFCLQNRFDFTSTKRMAIIRNPIDYYISLITFWCLDNRYCTELSKSHQELVDQLYHISRVPLLNKHIKFWISKGYTERKLETIVLNLLEETNIQKYKDKLILHHHTYDYYVFDILSKLKIGYYTFAFLDQYSRKKLTELETQEDCKEELLWIKHNFIILNQRNITHELKDICQQLDVPFKESIKQKVSNRNPVDDYCFSQETIELIHMKDKLMIDIFDL
jgi:hypothetical protein